ncbi:MAG: hypothetical protein ACJA1U_002224 [Bermanella sp.]|jgi:hypothetical protein
MNALFCVILVLSIICLMISFGVGPFANEPFYQWHLRFKRLHALTQKSIQLTAFSISVFCSLWIIGVFA